MSKTQVTRSRSVWLGALFVAVQLAVVLVVVGVSGARRREARLDEALPPLRNEPLTVRPLYDRPDFVSDEDLLDVLHQLRPRLRGDEPKINHVDHALRFWGVDAVFSDPECLSGEEMRHLLLDHDCFAQAWGEGEEPLLQHTDHCIGVRTKEGRATASHVDHTLASLAEVGTPLDYPIVTADGPSTMRGLLVNSLEEFEFNQVEYEWSTLAYVLYVESFGPFRDHYGQHVTFERLAERMMRERIKKGVCYGNHRLHGLVMMLRVDDQHDIIDDACREQIIEHLQETTARLVAAQDPAGFWNQHWDSGTPPLAGDDSESAQIDAISRKMLATGHALEWWALAPPEVLPPDEVIRRGCEWIAAEVIALDDESVRAKYTFLSHVGRAVALWRGNEPAHFIPAMEARHP